MAKVVIDKEIREYVLIEMEMRKELICQCIGSYLKKGESGCDNNHIDDEVFYKAFVEEYNAVVENKEHYMKK